MSAADPVAGSNAPGGPVEIEYFTDPLCSWSWAFEPQWRRLRYEYGGRVRWRYRMGGMIPDWSSYSDPLNSVCRPVQMAPQWIEVHHLSGMPLEAGVWIQDPPASSFPACLAFKAVERGAPSLAETYLRRLREAVMLHGRNIARREVLLELAASLPPGGEGPLDLERFSAEMSGEATQEAFRQDLMLARYRGVGRFPTLVIRGTRDRGVLLVGHRPYAMLQAALLHAAPEIGAPRACGDAAGYAEYWGGALPREIEEACQPSRLPPAAVPAAV